MMVIPTPNTKDRANAGMKGTKMGSPNCEAMPLTMYKTTIVPTACKIPVSITINQIPDLTVLSSVPLTPAF